MFLTVSEISHAEDCASMSFFFQSSLFPEPFPEIRYLFFLDHRVIMTRSSTCTSFTSILEELPPGSSTIDKADGGDVAKESVLLGDEQVLPCGLIWVAISLLETARDISVAASFSWSSFSSTCHPGDKNNRIRHTSCLNKVHLRSLDLDWLCIKAQEKLKKKKGLKETHVTCFNHPRTNSNPLV